MLDPIIECSLNRNWCFVSAPEGLQFISSDNPVVLTWTNNEDRGPYPPGHGLKGTMVLFPLCSDILLVGTFETLPKKILYEPDQVAAANNIIARYATNQIYARDGTFTIDWRGTIIQGEDLPKHFRKQSPSSQKRT